MFEITCPRRLSIVCFRYVPTDRRMDADALNLRLVTALLETGRGFLSSTRLRGQVHVADVLRELADDRGRRG